MTLLASVLAIALFAACASVLRLVPTTRRVTTEAARAMRLMRTDGPDEETKEREVRKAAVALFRLFVSIALRSVGAFAVPALSVQVLDYIGIVHAADVYRALISLPAALGAVAVLGVLYWVRRR